MSRTAGDAPIRVCHLIHDLRAGGAEHLLADLACLAPEAGLDLSVVSMMPLEGRRFSGVLSARGVPVRSLDLVSRWDPRGPRRARAALGGLRADVVHSHLKHADIVASFAAPRLGIPMVSTLHLIEDAVSPAGVVKREVAARRRMQRAACTIAVSEATRRWYLEQYGEDPGRVVTIHNGVRDPGPIPQEDRAGLREELGVPVEAPLVAMIALLRPGKGHDVLLEAAAAVPGAWFAVVGDGPEEDRLRDLARRLGVAERIVFAGFRDDVARVAGTADVVAHPTLADALPTSLIHSVAAGAAVVASDVGGIAEIIGDGAGVLVAPGDPAALSVAIAGLLQDGDRRGALGAAARRRFERVFEGRAWARRLGEVYRGVVSVGSVGPQ